ncbi:hypothetical protein [Microbacterium sp.]|uniref:hypothetical protein n=1 Tax=Microbacterium sp. TaxID=51671 RepID=UPI003567871D
MKSLLRRASAVSAFLLVLCASFLSAGAASASTAEFATTDVSVLSSAADVKDADDDTIPDVVEREVCGTATCAVGTEDEDADGIPDWTEVLSCDSNVPGHGRARRRVARNSRLPARDKKAKEYYS